MRTHETSRWAHARRLAFLVWPSRVFPPHMIWEKEHGRELPQDAGVTLSREEWLTKLETARGDPINAEEV